MVWAVHGCADLMAVPVRLATFARFPHAEAQRGEWVCGRGEFGLRGVAERG